MFDSKKLFEKLNNIAKKQKTTLRILCTKYLPPLLVWVKNSSLPKVP